MRSSLSTEQVGAWAKDSMERERIAKILCAEIMESEREKERLRERWIRNRAIWDCEENTSQVQLIEGMKPYMLPLSRTKGDRIVGAVVDGITSITPYVQVLDEGQPNVDLDDVERDLMTLAQDAGDDAAIREGTEDALVTNTGVWRVRPLVGERNYDQPQTSDSGRVTKIDWQAIDPVDVMCYPPYFGTFAAAKTVGHRYSDLVYRVKRDMADGRFFEYDVKGGDDPMRGHRSADDRGEEFEAQEVADEFVELWEVVSELDLKRDGRYAKYLCVVALTDQKLLSIQPYPYSTPWYVEVRTERERNRIFPNSSVMQRLQGLQLANSDMFTAIVQAAFASIGPITLLTGGGLMSKVTQAKPFMVIEAPADVKVTSIQAIPKVDTLPIALNMVQETADALTGVSRTGTSQQMPHSTTATEINGLLQAQQDAKDQYTQVVADSVERVFGLITEYYKLHYRELKKAYGNRLTASAEVVARLDPVFKVNGRNGANNPGVLLQKLQMLLGIIGGLPQSPYDATKVVEQIAQALELPFSLDRLKKDENPMGELLQQPQVLQLLMTGMPLPQILQAIQQHMGGGPGGAMGPGMAGASTGAGVAPPVDVSVPTSPA